MLDVFRSGSQEAGRMRTFRPLSAAARNAYITITFVVYEAIASTTWEAIYIAAAIGLVCDVVRYVLAKMEVFPKVGIPLHEERIFDKDFVNSKVRYYSIVVYGSMAIVVLHSLIYAFFAKFDGSAQSSAILYLEHLQVAGGGPLRHIADYAREISNNTDSDISDILIAFSQQSCFMSGLLFMFTTSYLGDTETFLYRFRAIHRVKIKSGRKVSILTGIFILIAIGLFDGWGILLPGRPGIDPLFHQYSRYRVFFIQFSTMNFFLFWWSYEIFSVLCLRCAGVDDIRPKNISQTQK